mgnify:CR=1 FL=1
MPLAVDLNADLGEDCGDDESMLLVVSTASVAACRQHGLDAVVGACPLMFLQPVESVHRVHLAVRRFNRECAPAGSRTR